VIEVPDAAPYRFGLAEAVSLAEGHGGLLSRIQQQLRLKTAA